MGTGIRKRPGTKSLPYLSHEFIIQNHGDIATCLCMVFVVGLMFQITSPLASAFITPAYNVTELSSTPVLYTYGFKDTCLVFFYTIAAVIFHAIVQEYVLDKISPKARLSKTKEKKFNESGQLFAFYTFSALWAFYIFREEGYIQSVSFLWTGYPHVGLTFLTKFFYIIQLSYWVHVLPELYFQKVKKEEMSEKITFAAINFFICAAFYLLNLTRIGLVLLSIDYTIYLLYHLSRLFYFSSKNKIAKISFNVYNILFVFARLTAIILAIFVFWFGLKNTSVEKVNFEEGNFNTPVVRLGCLTAILLVQAWMMWDFILFHCKQIRENAKPSTSKATHAKQTKKRSTKEDSDFDSDKDLKESPPSSPESKKSH